MKHQWNRMRLMIAQGEGTLIGHERVQAQVLDDEVLENIKRVEPYGFSYRPKPGCQTYLVFPGGDRSMGFALVIGDKRYQMTLVEGEVAIHDDEGNWVHIKRGGVIEVKASTEVIADTPLFRTTKDAEIGGNLRVKGRTESAGGYYGQDGEAGVMDGGLHVKREFTVNGKNVSDSHTHTSNGPGAPTSEVNG